jgi:hypothetical protein
MTDLEVLSERLARMERRFRWMKGFAIIGCIVIAAGAIMGQSSRPPAIPSGLDQLDELKQLPRVNRPSQSVPATPTEGEVRAQHFVLVDGKGTERASLVADAAGSVFLVMFDSKGKTRSQLSVSNDGPSLVFYDASAQPRLIAGSTTSVGSHVNENGIAEKAPASSIIMFDKAGKLLWREP